MKILEAGHGPKPEWVGRRLKCKKCFCKFQLEKGDNVKKLRYYCSDDSCSCDGHHSAHPYHILRTRCPKCKAIVKINSDKRSPFKLD